MNKRSGKEKPSLSTYYPTANNDLTFKECTAQILYYSKKIHEAGYDTTFLRDNISSIKILLELLETYECRATSLKNKNKISVIEGDNSMKSKKWYIKYPCDAYALGPVYFDKEVGEQKVREWARDFDDITRLPNGWQCWTAQGDINETS